MRKLARYGIAAAVIAAMAIPAPGQSASVNVTGVVKTSTEKAGTAAIRIAPATGQEREADVGVRLGANPQAIAAIERKGYVADDVVAMTTDADGAITVYVIPRD